MNIRAIGSNILKVNRASKGAENYSSYFRYDANSVDNYVRETIDSKWSTIGEYAKKHNTKVSIAQRGEELFVNSGALTECFNFMKCSSKEFIDNIMANIRKNSNINKNRTTIKKVLDSILQDSQGSFKTKFRTLVK